MTGLAPLLDRLAETLGPDGILTDPDSLRLHGSDLLDEGADCAFVVRPATVEALAEAVGLIGRAGIAMAPRGGGLTYVRGYTPADRRFAAIDLSRLDRVIAVSEEDMTITVEAGATWKQIHDALAPLGLRLPFFGTFSGSRATVGGGLSNGALFLGTARHVSAAEAVVGMEVVLADGSILHTGQRAVARAPRPFLRTFGPDTTGLFVHDAGALGIKARVTLRLIPAPGHFGYLSFGFERQADGIAALCEVARSDLAEDAYLMDADKTRSALSGPTDLLRDVRMLAKVAGQERGLLKGLRAGAKLALAGRSFIAAGCHSLHLVLAGRSEAAIAADRQAARAIAARFGGRELPDSIPRAGRADLFPPVRDMILGPLADRWIALNAKVPHSEAQRLTAAVEALLARRQSALDAAGVTVSRLITVMGTHAFSYEPVLNWRDAWLPLHRDVLGPATRLDEPPAAPDARALVMEVREELIALFAQLGAASNQIGRTYPYASVLRPQARALLEALKRAVDPEGLMNPGALELG
ncbi:FAD-binding oxidoreductase [Novosphingobium sp. ST904]|uniref:FAD-binding oxidoreductase n=1 Tax=Novosphingobium sp. ST904 TaxID=1684385 RepID=UPI0006C8A273|nr:FAD-binding oxidoreductase [Novosphingobium sp. ST904]KPH58146.1 FAD-linked oxidase [Novosphingobium sp. ST904]TCM41375.1 FAD/FMN-containing dehydrogenase [Novosphingobium sp. ST904]